VDVGAAVVGVAAVVGMELKDPQLKKVEICDFGKCFNIIFIYVRPSENPLITTTQILFVVCWSVSINFYILVRFVVN
jgi:hypothetical protein